MQNYKQILNSMNTTSLLGQTIVYIANPEDELIFTTESSLIFKYYHSQNCCESVWLDDICGDLDNIKDNPILVAEERSQADPNASESGTWTFYEFATIKGSVTIRWIGESNGYYSEEVDLKVSADIPKLKKHHPEYFI